MIFDLLTSPQGHQFDPRMKVLLAFVLLVIPVDLICYMTMFEKNCSTPWVPPVPQSLTPGVWTRRQNKNSIWYLLYLSFVWTHTKFGIKILEIDMVLNDIWPLTSPQSHQFNPRMKISLAFCSARHPRRFDIPHDHVWIFFYPLGTPSAPKSHPWGMTQGTEWKSRLICFVSFICENTHKVSYKNLWNCLCNWN